MQDSKKPLFVKYGLNHCVALVEAKKRGVHVEVLLDRSNEEEAHSDLHLLAEHQVPFLIDAKHAIAHNKVMVVDRRVILTGSFNFSNSARGNAENVLVIRDEALAKAYRTYIQSVTARYRDR